MNLHHENIVVNTNIGIRFWKSVAHNNGYVPFHWHASIELVYLLRGQLRFIMNGKSFVIKSNQFIVIPSGVVHAVSNIPNTAYVMQIPLKVIKPYVSHPELVVFKNNEIHDVNYKRAIKLIRSFGELQEHQPKGYRFDSQIVFVKLLKIIFTKLNNPSEFVKDDNQIKQIIIYVNNHYSKKLTVDIIANLLGYNANYLSRMFKQQVGISLVDYFYLVKLNKLYDDLINTNEPIKTLFKKNGLTNPRTARKHFKDMFGQLPNELRHQKAKE